MHNKQLMQFLQMILKSMGVECKKDDMDGYAGEVDEEATGKFTFLQFCQVNMISNDNDDDEDGNIDTQGRLTNRLLVSSPSCSPANSMILMRNMEGLIIMRIMEGLIISNPMTFGVKSAEDFFLPDWIKRRTCTWYTWCPKQYSP